MSSNKAAFSTIFPIKFLKTSWHFHLSKVWICPTRYSAILLLLNWTLTIQCAQSFSQGFGDWLQFSQILKVFSHSINSTSPLHILSMSEVVLLDTGVANTSDCHVLKMDCSETCVSNYHPISLHVLCLILMCWKEYHKSWNLCTSLIHVYLYELY